MHDSRETVGSSQFTTLTVPQSPATRWAPTDHHAKHTPWTPDESVSSHCLSPGISGNQGGARELLHLGASQGPRVPWLLRGERLSPRLREKTASTAFPGSAQKQQQGRGRGRRLHCTPPQLGLHPCTRKSQHTVTFFARCFLTTNDGIKVFWRVWPAGLSGRSLDAILWRKKGGTRLGGRNKGNDGPRVDQALWEAWGY